jgi:ABC-type dipeptide/oligopeptide/nickel transport system permease subunit
MMTPDSQPATDLNERKREIERRIDNRIKWSYYISESINYFPLVLFLILIGLVNNWSYTTIIVFAIMGIAVVAMIVRRQVNTAFKKAAESIDHPKNI